MREALELRFRAHEVHEQSRCRVPSDGAELHVPSRGCAIEIGRDDVIHGGRARQIETPRELGEARRFRDDDAEQAERLGRQHDL